MPCCGILQWAAESFVTIGSSEIVCTALTSPGESCSNTVFLYFNATLTSFQPITGPGEQGNITSSLTITANSYTTGKLIYCSNGRLSQNESPNTLFHIGGNYRLILFQKVIINYHDHCCFIPVPPLPPPSITHSIDSYGITEYSVRVQWQTPSNDGGVGISNYTLTITSDGGETVIKEIITLTERVVVSLNYTTTYSLYVRAKNCVGSSNSTCAITFSQG